MSLLTVHCKSPTAETCTRTRTDLRSCERKSLGVTEMSTTRAGGAVFWAMSMAPESDELLLVQDATP